MLLKISFEGFLVKSADHNTRRVHDAGSKMTTREYRYVVYAVDPADGDTEPVWSGNDLADAFRECDRPNDSRQFTIRDDWTREWLDPNDTSGLPCSSCRRHSCLCAERDAAMAEDEFEGRLERMREQETR